MAMAHFIQKLFIFLLPVGLVFAFPLAIFLVSREEYSIQAVVNMQIADPNIVVGKAYTDTDNTGLFYKSLLVDTKKPSIIVIGSSRSMELRKEFFADQDSFVNASYSWADTARTEAFIRKLPQDSRVKVIILGLDRAKLRSDFVDVVPNSAPTTLGMLRDFIRLDWRWIYYDYVRGRFSLHDLLERSVHTKDIGLAALIDRNGFRGDGSRMHGQVAADSHRTDVLAARVKKIVEGLKKDRGSFDYGLDISTSSLSSLDSVLTLAQERHITIIGYLPPDAPAINAEILSVDDEYRKVALRLPKVVHAIFSRHGFKDFDFSDAAVLGGAREEFLDETHPTDKLDLRMLIYMAKRDPALRAYVDIPKAEALLKNTNGDFLPLNAIPDTVLR